MEDAISQLIKQLRCVILDKPISTDMKTNDEAFLELQEAIDYLSACLSETKVFLRALCAGKLTAEPPGRHNFIAGNLKELHSILKHLTWQANQIANGDYNQRVSFLGEFSDSFNIMIEQLKDREIKLTEKSEALSKTMALLTSVLDTQRDWVIVTNSVTHKVLYANLSAKRRFYDTDMQKTRNPKDNCLFDFILNNIAQADEEVEYNYHDKDKIMLIRSLPVNWNEQGAYVHYISDITDEHEEREHLQDMAYKDALTNCYNRRYCVNKIRNLIDKETFFSLVLIDLDGLKVVNDTFGHILGDDYIQTVAEAISTLSRADDRLCRIGGDEFILILPDCNEKNAERKMQRVVASLEQENKEYSLRISYGVIHVSDTIVASPEDLFSMADIRMYAMKQKHKATN